MDKQIIVYEPNDQMKMEVKTDGETVWLTIDQMAMLFGRDKSVIGKHVRNVFLEGELPQEGFRQILPKTSAAGGRPLAIYNLDVVISVGYRVKSFEGYAYKRGEPRIMRTKLSYLLKPIKKLVHKGWNKRWIIVNNDMISYLDDINSTVGKNAQ